MTFSNYFLCLILFFQIQSVYATDAYKWTDSDGHIHYSATPPSDQETKSVGVTSGNPDAQSTPTVKNNRCAKATYNDLIIGEWISKKTITVSMRFSKRHIQGHKSPRYIRKYYISVDRRSLQSGIWKLTGDILKLSITKRGRVRTRFTTITRVDLLSVSTQYLNVIINGNTKMMFKRYTGSGNIPKCMRYKRRR
jgi:hypothetical protein